MIAPDYQSDDGKASTAVCTPTSDCRLVALRCSPRNPTKVMPPRSRYVSVTYIVAEACA